MLSGSTGDAILACRWAVRDCASWKRLRTLQLGHQLPLPPRHTPHHYCPHPHSLQPLPQQRTSELAPVQPWLASPGFWQPSTSPPSLQPTHLTPNVLMVEIGNRTKYRRGLAQFRCPFRVDPACPLLMSLPGVKRGCSTVHAAMQLDLATGTHCVHGHFVLPLFIPIFPLLLKRAELFPPAFFFGFFNRFIHLPLNRVRLLQDSSLLFFIGDEFLQLMTVTGLVFMCSLSDQVELSFEVCADGESLTATGNAEHTCLLARASVSFLICSSESFTAFEQNST